MQRSPISQLPLEIFVEIISLVTEPTPLTEYTSAQIPRPRKGRPNALFTCMRVCRAWRRSILSTARFWTTLKIDGTINNKNAERKALWVAERAAGGDPSLLDAKRNRTRISSPAFPLIGAGIQRVVITAAQELSEQAFDAVLAVVAGSTTLRQVVCSFADGLRTTSSVQTEARRASRLVNLLHERARETLQFVSICTGGRIYPDFDLGHFFVAFPNLVSLNLRGSAVSSFIVGINAAFLRPSFASLAVDAINSSDELAAAVGTKSESPAPTRARSVTITGAVFVSDTSCHLASFPQLEHLELDIVGAGTIWQLLSAPRLRTFRATLFGESHVVNLPIPDLAAAWSHVEDLRLGGAKRFAARLLQEAIRIGPLRFNHLRDLDLSFANLTNEQLSVLFDSTNSPMLETMSLASTTASPSEVKLVLPSRLDALRRLNISHTAWATDDTIRALIVSAPRLEALEARGNVSLSGRPLMELVRARMSGEDDLAERGEAGPYSCLTTLALEGCTKIETPAVEWLRKHIRPGGVKFQFMDPCDRRSSYCY